MKTDAPSHSKRLDIAIVGMGCVFPGANDVEAYWRNIVSGEPQFSRMPESLWAERHFLSEDPKDPKKSYTLHGAFIDQNIEFPFVDFRLPPKVVRSMDYAQVVALESTRQALLDAGIAPGSSQLEDAIVVLGMSGVDSYCRSTAFYDRHYVLEHLREVLADDPDRDAKLDAISEEMVKALEDRGYAWKSATLALGDVQSTVTNRVAQVFGIGGFNMTTDAACASSFSSLEVASHALLAGDARVAIVGGVDLGTNPAIYVGFARVAGLSKSNRACPFDASADGLMIGEGGGVLVVKKLEDALADGDQIHAVVRGVGSASDGKGKAIYNPDKEGRVLCFRRGLENAGIDPSDVSFLEAHATSTVVGDANEYDCVGEVYGEGRQPGRPLYLGSVKHQIGHLKAAAGVAGLIKVVMGMRHGQIPHLPEYRELTKAAEYTGPGLAIPNKILPWEPSPTGSRIGAVTASGFGGINYHVLLERADSYEAPVRPPVPAPEIAIVGVSCEVPGASDPEEFWQNMEAGADVFSEVDHESLGWIRKSDQLRPDETIISERVGLLKPFKFENLKYRIFPSAISQIAPTQLLGIHLAGKFYDPKTKDRRNTAVILGAFHNDYFSNIFHQMLGDLYSDCLGASPSFTALDVGVRERVLEKVANDHDDIHPAITEHTMPGWMGNCLAGRISKTFNLIGANYIVDTACSSSVAALIAAKYQLMFGDADEVLTGGINRPTSGVLTAGVATIGAMTERTPRPYDVDGSGFLLGEGGVFFRVKLLEDARRDGDEIKGVVHALGGSSEQKAKHMMAPSEAAVRRSVRSALRKFEPGPGAIGVVDTHGSANAASDRVEAQALAAEIGSHREGGVRLTAVKSHVGHLYGGAGASSMLSVLESLGHHKVPGIQNLRQPTPEVQACAPAAVPQMGTEPLDASYGAVNSIGLGGANYFAVVSREDVGKQTKVKMPKSTPAKEENHPMVATGWERTYVAGASDLLSLAQATEGPAAINGPRRLAFHYKDDAHRERNLETFRSFVRSGRGLKTLEGQGIYVMNADAESANPVFVFPGQGTQYFEMGRYLFDRSERFRTVVQQVSAFTQREFGFSLENSLYAEDDGQLNGLAGGQLSIYAVEVGIGMWLMEQGVKPALMVGHSFGEYAALTLSGAWTLDNGMRAVAARIRACETCPPNLGMVSVICSEKQADALAVLVDGLYLSNRNAPGRYVFGGTQAQVQAAKKIADAMGAKADILEIRAAFHTPLMDSARSALRRTLANIPAGAPRVPVLSTSTGLCYPDGLDRETVADWLSMQLVNRLDFERDIKWAAAQGHRTFIEVGPKWSAMTMIGQILSGTDHHVVPTLHPKPGEGTTIARTLAFLVASGGLSSGPQAASTSLQPSPRPPREPMAASAFKLDELSLGAWSRALSWRPPGAEEAFNIPKRKDVPAKGLFKGRRVNGTSAPRAAQRVASATTIRSVEAPARVAAPAAMAASGPSGSLDDWKDRLRVKLVAKTGYPAEMLEDELDLEADLGIDSVQRAEIWSELLEQHGFAPDLDPGGASTLALLAQVLVDAGGGASSQAAAPAPAKAAPAPAPAAASGVSVSAATWAERLRERLVVKTGYPAEMLEDHLDLEADLGIDSVQRAEIWSELLSDNGMAADLDPGGASSLAGLAEVLAQASAQSGGASSEPAPLTRSRLPAPAPETPMVVTPPPDTADTRVWAERLRTRLVEKTGYPAEMLEAGLDLEADLGIDSVQRAEIWSELLQAHQISPDLDPGNAATISALAEVLAEANGQNPTQAAQGSKALAAAQPDAQAGDNASIENSPANPEVLALMHGVTAQACVCATRPSPIDTVLLVCSMPHTDLEQSLVKRGVNVTRTTPAQAAKALSSVASGGTVVYAEHLELLDRAENDDDEELVASHLDRLYGFFQSQAATLTKLGAHIVVPIAQDGCFGVRARTPDPRRRLGAFPAGFIKALALEWEGCKFQLIDVHESGIADGVAFVLDHASKTVELGLVNGAPCRPVLAELPGDAAPTRPIARGKHLLVSGGARGIVFECVYALAKKHGLGLVLTGRTPLATNPAELPTAEPNEISAAIRELELRRVREDGMTLPKARAWGAATRRQWELHRNLARLGAAGIPHQYSQCDVGDPEQLAALAERLASEGDVAGLVHGAGIQRSKLIEKLDPADVKAVVQTKLGPLMTLRETSLWDQLTFISCFGSVSGVFGNAGQTDYALANDAMTWLARASAAPGAATSTVQWTAWGGTGMVTERELERFAKMGLDVLDVDTGTEIFVRSYEQAAGRDVVVVNDDGTFGASRKADEAAVFPTSYMTRKDDAVFVSFDPEGDAFLEQHHVRGRPVVPGTFILDMFRAMVGDGQVLRDVRFRRPLWVRSRDERFMLRREGDQILLVSPRYTDVPEAARKNLVFASCMLGEPTGEALATLTMPRSEQTGRPADDGFYGALDSKFGDVLRTGPLFRGVLSTWEDQGDYHADILVSEDGQRLVGNGSRRGFDPLTGDMAVQVLASWALERFGAVYIPWSIAGFRTGVQPSGGVAHVTCREIEMDKKQVRGDVAVIDQHGQPLFELQDLTLRSVQAK